MIDVPLVTNETQQVQPRMNVGCPKPQTKEKSKQKEMTRQSQNRRGVLWRTSDEELLDPDVNVVSARILVRGRGDRDVEVVGDGDVVGVGVSVPADRQPVVIVQGALGGGARGKLPVAEPEDEGGLFRDGEVGGLYGGESRRFGRGRSFEVFIKRCTDSIQNREAKLLTNRSNTFQPGWPAGSARLQRLTLEPGRTVCSEFCFEGKTWSR